MKQLEIIYIIGKNSKYDLIIDTRQICTNPNNWYINTFFNTLLTSWLKENHWKIF